MRLEADFQQSREEAGWEWARGLERAGPAAIPPRNVPDSSHQGQEETAPQGMIALRRSQALGPGVCARSWGPIS